MAEKRTGLGRGLDALLPGRQPLARPGVGAHAAVLPEKQVPRDARNDNSVESAASVVIDKDALAGAREIPLELIERNPYQTRGKIDEAALEELAASIREQGVLQPILLREIRGGSHPSLRSEWGSQNRSPQPSAIGGQGSQSQTQSPSREGRAQDDKGNGVGDPTLSPKDGERMGHPNLGDIALSGQTPPNDGERMGHPNVGGVQSGAVRYQLMAGERRWLAAQRAGLKMIPAVVKQASDEQAMEITIIENLQREDLNPMEQARAFERLSREFQLTQEQIAVKTGKDRASVSNFLRLLKLPGAVQQMIESDALSLGHGKVLMMLMNEPPEMVERVAGKAAESGMSVRDLEEAIMKLMGPPRGAQKQIREARDPNIRAAEEDIQRALGCKVAIKDRGGKGSILLEYASLEDFDRIVEVLGKR